MSSLNLSPSASEHELRRAILECGQICYQRGLMTSNDGNISIRIDANRVLITAAGICKGRLEMGDLLIIDLNGNIIISWKGLKPSSETPMHLEVYKQRPEIHAVIHAHPVYATTLTVADQPFPHDILPEVALTLGNIPVTAYATPSSHQDAEAIRPFIREHNALLLRQHGSLTVGKDLDEALIHLERLEHVAQVYWNAHMLGNVTRIPPDELTKLMRKP
jgi:L-fuculose-phosphate aldolase